jgi:hypothetical protein
VSKPLIIGFSGRARHGKTICCDTIYKHARSRGFLANIYDIGGMIRLVAIDEGRLPDVPRESMTRDQLQILIDIGKEKRSISENYWVERVLAQVEKDKPSIALCPNLRLPMEADAFHKAGGYVVRCTRLNENGSLFISEDRPPNDITETALEFWPADFYLTTKPDQIEFLERQSIALYEYLLNPQHGPIERHYEQRRTV